RGPTPRGGCDRRTRGNDPVNAGLFIPTELPGPAGDTPPQPGPAIAALLGRRTVGGFVTRPAQAVGRGRCAPPPRLPPGRRRWVAPASGDVDTVRGGQGAVRQVRNRQALRALLPQDRLVYERINPGIG